jgi:hypothetical protein
LAYLTAGLITSGSDPQLGPGRPFFTFGEVKVEFGIRVVIKDKNDSHKKGIIRIPPNKSNPKPATKLAIV